jgi:hypothetical protein
MTLPTDPDRLAELREEVAELDLDVDVRRLLVTATRLGVQAQAALADEHEGDLRAAVEQLHAIAAQLHHVVTNW